MGTNNRTCVCWRCRVTARGYYRTCQECGQPMERLSRKARVPKKTAPDKDWREFRRRFGKGPRTSGEAFRRRWIRLQKNVALKEKYPDLRQSYERAPTQTET